MKKIIILLTVSIATLFGAFIAYEIPAVREGVSKLMPLELKKLIKHNLFIVSYQKEQIAARESEIRLLEKELQSKNDELEKNIQDKFFQDLSVGAVKTWPLLAPIYTQSKNSLLLERAEAKKIVASDNERYTLNAFPLPFLPPALAHGYKPLFYIDSTESKVVLITGEGVVFMFDKSDINKSTVKLETIPSNIRSMIVDKSLYEPSWFSIKDLYIDNNSAYISYNKKVGNNYTLGILVAELNSEKLEFKEFFTLPDSVDTGGKFNAHQLGGRIVKYKDETLLISSGDMSKWEKAQDDNTLLGKIFSIDIETKETQIISKGHRNPQGLFYDEQTGVIFSTEHGPNGGDEINLNLNKEDSNRNFGWPMASYGLHYDSRFHENAPLHKSHKEHGYREPLKQYTPSVGPSEIIKVPNRFKRNFRNDYFTAIMGLNHSLPIQSLHHFRMNADYSRIDHESIIVIGERIRDIHSLNSKQILLALEGNGTPAIGILSSD